MRGINAHARRLFGGRQAGPARHAGHRRGRTILLRLAYCLCAGAAAITAAAPGLQDAAAQGETRSLSFYHTHTGERLTVAFRRNGQSDPAALEQLNHFLRDWRVNEPATMDPRLFDILWEVYRESGSREPIHIISAYRSPGTNAALRRRSKGVSEHSQHMLGKAMDIRLPDVDTGRLRAIAMKMQYGGVGYYPSSAFVHVDTGSVRAWPRMSQEQLARLFPDGKTLHLPANGKPLPGYELAKAEILPRNAALAAGAAAGAAPSATGLLANLFGRKNPPAPPPEESATMAYASVSDEARPAPATAPIPPRRPQGALVASVEAVASIRQSAPVSSVPVVLGYDHAFAVQALFDRNGPQLDLGFTRKTQEELSPSRFTGLAVKPLPIIRQAQASL